MGEPTAEQKEMYTRVLMGQIQLASLTFPDDMAFSSADVMARAPLWKIGAEYLHGTGHGIGAFLNVHESPLLSYKGVDNLIEEGYFISNGS